MNQNKIIFVGAINVSENSTFNEKEEIARKRVLQEWMYWYNSFNNNWIFADNSEGRHARAIVASNLTIASLKFQEE